MSERLTRRYVVLIGTAMVSQGVSREEETKDTRTFEFLGLDRRVAGCYLCIPIRAAR